MEKKLINQKELSYQYYILKMKYRLSFDRYFKSLKETHQKHEEMVKDHQALLDFINSNGTYDKVCPPSNNGFNI